MDIVQKKKEILEFAKLRGPILPSDVVRHTKLSLLYASAIMSEMVADKMLKMSNLKIGGSPLYFAEGDEVKLENFSNKLAQPEQEVFDKLKNSRVLEDEKLTPTQRVALRSIKDFAVPMNIKLASEEQEKIFWRFHTTGKEEATQIVKGMLKLKETKSKKIAKAKKEAKQVTEKKLTTQTTITKPATAEKTREAKPEVKKTIEKPQTTLQEQKPRIERKSKTEFREKVHEYIKSNFNVEKELNEADTFFIINSRFQNSHLGSMNFIVTAKNKKSINDADLSLMYQKSMQHKMPVLFLTQGKMTKKAQAYYESIKNSVIVKELK